MFKYFLTIFLFFSNVYADSDEYTDSEVVEIDLIIKDHKFQPEEIEVPAGRLLRLTIHNQDSSIEEFDSPDLKREKLIPPHSFVHIKLARLPIGRYCFIGEFHADTARGCLIVK